MTDNERQEIIDLIQSLNALNITGPANIAIRNKAANFLRVLGKRVNELEHRYGQNGQLRFNVDRDDYE